MSYNLNSTWAANNTVEMMGAINTASDGLLIGMFMMTLFIAILVVFNRNDMKKILLVDSFVMVIIGSICMVLGWVATSTVVIIPIILTFISLILNLFTE